MNHTKFCRMPPICTYISKLRWAMRSLITYIESFNIILLHCLWLHIYSNRPMKFGRSKLGMYVKTWLPSNPQQQLIYSIIHLFIALANKNSTFPRRHFKKITSIPFECATYCYTLWMGHWQREWIKKTLWFLDYTILQHLVDILMQQVSSPDN